MDRLNSPAYGPPQQQSTYNRATTEGRQSFDSQRLQLRKKRSYNNAGVRNASQPLPATASPQTTPARDPGDNERARRGTLRNVVRRIFGRRSKEFDSQPPVRASPPRHGYHRSEPPALSIPKNSNHHGSAEDSTIPHRTLSAPVQHLLPPLNLDRQRSPYAVEFPHSARLKPLNLANPFTAPGSQLRRRKTLPSLLLPDNKAPPQTADDDNARQSPDRPQPSHLGSEPVPISPGRRRRCGSGPPGTPRTSKRKSRSVGDLKFFQRAATTTAEQTSPRKRNEELRIWRDSLQGYKDDQVLRASGFTSAMVLPPPVEVEGRFSGEVHGVEEPVSRSTAVADQPFPARGSPGRATVTAGDGDAAFMRLKPIYNAGGLAREEGTMTEEEEISHDLEDRVARLEAGLQHFQLSLQRMTTTDRSPSSSSRPVVVSGQSRTPPSSRRRRPQRDDGGVRGGVDYARTPSMLADTLSADFLSSPHHHHRNGSSAGYEDDDNLHRLPSSSPLQYYYRQPSVLDPQRPETPLTPPSKGAGLSSPSSHHHHGSLPAARPTMPPFPRMDSTATTTTMTEDEEEDEEENFPFPAQAASFSVSAERNPVVAAAVDSPSEPPDSDAGLWMRKASGGFHFPFPSSFQLQEQQECRQQPQLQPEEEPQQQQYHQEQQQQRQLQHEQKHGQESELRPLRPDPLKQQQQQQQQQQQEKHNHHHHDPQDYTFKSLYEMLADERSARRNLEGQLKGLRREIRALHLQVSSSSSPSSPVGEDVSADVPPGSGRRISVGPSMARGGRRGDREGFDGRLWDLVSRGAGDSGHTAFLSQRSSRHAVGSQGDGVISRFSGSESEVGGGVGGGADETKMRRYEEQRGVETDEEDEDELMTPLEAYQTPREETSRFGLRDGVGAF